MKETYTITIGDLLEAMGINPCRLRPEVLGMVIEYLDGGTEWEEFRNGVSGLMADPSVFDGLWQVPLSMKGGSDVA